MRAKPHRTLLLSGMIGGVLIGFVPMCSMAAPFSGAVQPSSVLLHVPFFPDRTDQCGPSTLAGLLSFWGKQSSPQELRKEIYVSRLHGTLPMDLVLAAQFHGLKTRMTEGTVDILKSELRAHRPVLVMLNLGLSLVPVDHYVLVTGFDEDRGGFFIHSAGHENQFITYKTFLRQWEKTDYWTLLAQSA